QIRHAEQRLRESRIQLQAQPPAEADLLEEFIQQNQLVRQQVQAEFENQMRQAEAALAEGDVTRARDLAAAARLTASSRAVYFSETEMANFNTAVDALQARIAETER